MSDDSTPCAWCTLPAQGWAYASGGGGQEASCGEHGLEFQRDPSLFAAWLAAHDAEVARQQAEHDAQIVRDSADQLRAAAAGVTLSEDEEADAEEAIQMLLRTATAITKPFKRYATLPWTEDAK